MVYCAALKLCTAVTEYLAKAIIYLEDQSLGIVTSRNSANVISQDVLSKTYLQNLGPKRLKLMRQLFRIQVRWDF